MVRMLLNRLNVCWVLKYANRMEKASQNIHLVLWALSMHAVRPIAVQVNLRIQHQLCHPAQVWIHFGTRLCDRPGKDDFWWGKITDFIMKDWYFLICPGKTKICQIFSWKTKICREMRFSWIKNPRFSCQTSLRLLHPYKSHSPSPNRQSRAA